MNSNRVRLLVVDDDPVTVDLLREVLSNEGYEVRTALTGEEAISQASETFFDIMPLKNRQQFFYSLILSFLRYCHFRCPDGRSGWNGRAPSL